MLKQESEINHSVELLRSFWNLQRRLIRSVQKTANDHGLSIPQYSILMTIMHHKEMSQKIVREKTHLPKSTLSQSIDKLVNINVLNRNPVEDDRREVLLSVNEKGKELIKAIFSQKNGVHQKFHHAVESLSDEQIQEMTKILIQISSYFEE